MFTSDQYVAQKGDNVRLAAAINIISNPRHQAMLVLERFGTHWVPRCATILLGPILRNVFGAFTTFYFSYTEVKVQYTFRFKSSDSFD